MEEHYIRCIDIKPNIPDAFQRLRREQPPANRLSGWIADQKEAAPLRPLIHQQLNQRQSSRSTSLKRVTPSTVDHEKTRRSTRLRPKTSATTMLVNTEPKPLRGTVSRRSTRTKPNTRSGTKQGSSQEIEPSNSNISALGRGTSRSSRGNQQEMDSEQVDVSRQVSDGRVDGIIRRERSRRGYDVSMVIPNMLYFSAEMTGESIPSEDASSSRRSRKSSSPRKSPSKSTSTKTTTKVMKSRRMAYMTPPIEFLTLLELKDQGDIPEFVLRMWLDTIQPAVTRTKFIPSAFKVNSWNFYSQFKAND